jgi:hypothetical protein
MILLGTVCIVDILYLLTFTPNQREWLTILTYDPNAGQGQNVYPLVLLYAKIRDAFVSVSLSPDTRVCGRNFC